jgi:hypothetical protein
MTLTRKTQKTRINLISSNFGHLTSALLAHRQWEAGIAIAIALTVSYQLGSFRTLKTKEELVPPASGTPCTGPKKTIIDYRIFFSEITDKADAGTEEAADAYAPELLCALHTRSRLSI